MDRMRPRAKLRSLARRGALAALGIAGLALAGCNARTAAVDPDLGVVPSPKLIGSGKPIPAGGGVRKVGKPYKVGGRWYHPREDEDYEATGEASWYGKAFHGRRTANGEVFDMHSLTGAHPTLPLPSYVRVTNLKNDHSVVIRINDRGPFSRSRIVDVSARAAELLDFKRAGTAKVKVEYVGPAKMNPTDHSYLLASFRRGGKAPPARGKEGIREDERRRGPDMSPARSVLIASRPARPAREGIDSDRRSGSPIHGFLPFGDKRPDPAASGGSGSSAPRAETAASRPDRSTAAAPPPAPAPAASKAPAEAEGEGADALDALILMSGEADATGETAAPPEPVASVADDEPATDRVGQAHAAFEATGAGLSASPELDALTLVRAAGKDGS